VTVPTTPGHMVHISLRHMMRAVYTNEVASDLDTRLRREIIAELVGFRWLSGHNAVVAAYEERTCQTKL
jgi:hypothetical protein